MNIEDEIRVKKEKIRADMKKKEEAEQLSAALRNARMCPASCVLRLPPSELQPVIKETMPFMRFSNPKIVRSMPDGRTLVREIQYKESPDMYSFDAQLYSDGTVYISDKLTILHGQSDHLSRRFRSLISERYSR